MRGLKNEIIKPTYDMKKLIILLTVLLQFTSIFRCPKSVPLYEYINLTDKRGDVTYHIGK